MRKLNILSRVKQIQKKVPDVQFCIQSNALYILGVDVAFEVKDEACGHGQQKLYTEHISRYGLTTDALFLKMLTLYNC